MRGFKRGFPFCKQSSSRAGFPVISSLEVRPLPAGAYRASSDDLRDTVLRKRYRINCGYQHKAPLSYPFDHSDRIWDEDQKFHPSRLSGAFYMPLALKFSGLKENPPLVVLQTARVLARRNVLSYRFRVYTGTIFYLKSSVCKKEAASYLICMNM